MSSAGAWSLAHESSRQVCPQRNGSWKFGRFGSPEASTFAAPALGASSQTPAAPRATAVTNAVAPFLVMRILWFPFRGVDHAFDVAHRRSGPFPLHIRPRSKVPSHR